MSPEKRPLRARDIEDQVREHFLRQSQSWAALREVTIDDVVALDEHRARLGLDPERLPSWRPAATYRRIDLLLMKTSAFARPVPFERLAIEIKVSRADFRRETPEKRRAWQEVTHRFAYAVPRGLIAKTEVPPGCGLLEVHTEETWKVAIEHHNRQHARWAAREISQYPPYPTAVAWTVRAPQREGGPRPLDDRFVAYLAGRASRAEDELRRLEKQG